MVAILIHGDIVVMDAAALLYKYELFGDKYQTISLCLLYNNYVFVQQLKKAWLNTRKNQSLTIISNSILIYHPMIQNLNHSMHTLIVNVRIPLLICMASFHHCRTLFWPKSSYIIFMNALRWLFPTQFKDIVCFLNKGGSLDN